MVGSTIATLIGRPTVLGAEVFNETLTRCAFPVSLTAARYLLSTYITVQVFAVVEEMAKDKKVITLKFRRRKNSKNIRGFRRQVTILRIKDIHVTADHARDLGVQPPRR